MRPPTRYGLYVTPEPGAALAAFGHSTLGDGTLGDAAVPGWVATDRATLVAVTAGPRVPRDSDGTDAAHLGSTEGDLLAACAVLAEARASLPIGPLAVVLIEDFAALVATAAPPGLGLLTAERVAALDPFRESLTPAKRDRRRPERLDPRRRALLDHRADPTFSRPSAST